MKKEANPYGKKGLSASFVTENGNAFQIRPTPSERDGRNWGVGVGALFLPPSFDAAALHAWGYRRKRDGTLEGFR
jgi:hypothetical protein